MEGLIDREEIQLDLIDASSNIQDKVVYVTGGGGSIGSGLCKFLIELNPKMLVIFDNHEYSLYKVWMDIGDRINVKYVLGDVRDKLMFIDEFAENKPDIVYHAAAYKHVPMLENFPSQAVLNNVKGTRDLAALANESGCNKFVFVSTDKAVNPNSVLGATKRIGELYCDFLNRRGDCKFLSVRFGNVADTTGSVIPLFRKQIEEGGPVTVTDTKTSRYFMYLSEACKLLTYIGLYEEDTGIYMLKMGDPVSIDTLAKKMVWLMTEKLPGVNGGIDIVYTKLRPGEKLHEELYNELMEVEIKTANKHVFRLKSSTSLEVFNVYVDELIQEARWFKEDAVRKLLKDLR